MTTIDLDESPLAIRHNTDAGFIRRLLRRWMQRKRDSQGRLQWNTTLFPSGGKALGDYLHGLGLDFGLYSGGGYFQCGSTDLPASLGKFLGNR